MHSTSLGVTHAAQLHSVIDPSVHLLHTGCNLQFRILPV